MNEQNTSQSRKKVEIRHHPQKIIISLWLDDYDDFFSDFDPRSFSHRALSDDFLYEAKKVIHETKPGFLDMTFLVPHNRRNKAEEKIIATRLQSHFRKQYAHLEKEYRRFIRNGIMMTGLGVLLMFGAITTMHLTQYNFFWNYARVLLEPSGWFLAWFGLDHIFYISRQNRHEMDFNRQMSRADFRFDAY